MAPSMFRFFAAGGLMLVFLLLVLLNPQPTNSLDISVFPHYQTFDSWDNCSYVGTCYELYCNSLKGGWANPEYHDNVPPYTQAVRSWWVNSGPTTSNLDSNQNPLPCNKITTGPCYDHTSGSGKYLYAESSACFGYYFHATTPTFIFTAANASISFYYYMNGADLTVTNKNAHLRLKMSLSNGTNWMTIMDVSGRQQTNATQEWSHFETILDSYFSYVPSPTSPVVADFMFEALTGGDDSGTYWKSDIAIDDVYWTQAGAPNTTDPYIDVTNTNTGGGTVGEGSGDGISDGEIAGIVVGVAGGLGALCCCLLLLLLLLLLAISPRGPKKGAAPAEAAEGDAGL